MRIKGLLLLVAMQMLMATTYAQTFWEVSPTYPGGSNAMGKYIRDSFRFPSTVTADKITGKCYVKLIIDADGNICEATVLKGISADVDEELLRVFKSMPKWTPGKLIGSATKGEVVAPVILNFNRKQTASTAPKQEQKTAPASPQTAAKQATTHSQPAEDFLQNWKKQYSHSSDEYPISPNAKTVYINNYETDYQFADGMLAIQNKETGKWGFIDEDGNLLKGGYKWQYADFKKPRFGAGHCLVALRNTNNPRKLDWYILDKKGNSRRFNVGAEIAEVSHFNADGIVAVMVKADYSGRIRYFKSDGTEVYRNLSAPASLAMEVVPLGEFKDNRALCYNSEKRVYGYINRSGSLIGNKTYQDAQEYSQGLAAVVVNTESGRRWGYIDVNGSMVIPAKFSKEPSPFTFGYAIAEKQNGKKVFINKQGEVCNAEYDRLINFVNGYALASISTKCYIIDTNMKAEEVKTSGFDHSTLREMEKNLPVKTAFDGKYIIYDGVYMSTGLIWPQNGKKYNTGRGPYSENRVHVKVDRGVYKGEEHYFLDRTGQVVIKFAKEEF